MHRCRKPRGPGDRREFGCGITKGLLSTLHPKETTETRPHPQLRGLKTLLKISRMTFDPGEGESGKKREVRGLKCLGEKKKKKISACMGHSFCQKHVELIVEKCILK